jgi:hypothetical protein
VEEGQAVATTKEKQQAPQLNKNVPDHESLLSWRTKYREKRDSILSNLSEISAVSVAATFGVLIINHAENHIEIAS